MICERDVITNKSLVLSTGRGRVTFRVTNVSLRKVDDSKLYASTASNGLWRQR